MKMKINTHKIEPEKNKITVMMKISILIKSTLLYMKKRMKQQLE